MQGTLFDVEGSSSQSGKTPGGERVFYARDYQIDATNRIFQEWQASNSTIVVMATGLGKTVIATRVCERVLAGEVGPGGFLFLAHRDELITQTYDTFRAVFPDRIIEVEKASDYAGGGADIVIASVQSMSQPRRLEHFRPDRFAAGCVDEAHHAIKSNSTYQTIRSKFQTKWFGLTATPDREDEAALGEVFDSVAFQFDILDGIDEGYLVSVGQRLERCEGLDYSAIRMDKDGDFNEDDLAEQLKKEKPLYALCSAATKFSNWQGKTRPTLVFSASRDHAETVAEILNRSDFKYNTGRAACLHYKIKSQERREIIREYKRGNIRYLTNYGILGEGFDDDETRVIINGRPTRSRALFAQMFGRATRPLKEILPLLAACQTAAGRRAVIKASRKPGALMVDLMGVNHKLVLTMADILGGRNSEEAVKIVQDRLARANGPVDVEEELRKAEEIAAKQRVKDAATKRREGVTVSAAMVGKNVDPFNVFDVSSNREMGWSVGKAATPPQVDLLKKFGIPDRELEGISRHKASGIISACMNRRRLGMCSFKVARILRDHGYDPNLTAEEGSRIITELKSNGWRRNE